MPISLTALRFRLPLSVARQRKCIWTNTHRPWRFSTTPVYVSSGYGQPTLEKLAPGGGAEWSVTLPSVSDAWQ